MKQNYNNPHITIVEIGDLCDIVTSSNDNEIVIEGGHHPDARQRNPIWDDYE